MAKRSIKIIAVLIGISLLVCSVVLLLNAKNTTSPINYDMEMTINPTTNFFGQKEDQTPVVEALSSDVLLTRGYIQVCENESLALFVEEKSMGIAVYDKAAHYIWYSCYDRYLEGSYTDAVKNIITSGVIIECFDSTTLNEATRYSANDKETKLTYTYLADGFKCHTDFYTSGISFDVEVKIDGANLSASALLDTLEEVPYKTKAMKYAKEYKLKSIILFPYLGSENYDINGYAFIPDGSGALIRFTDTAYNTAYIKRLYGDDLGLATSTTAAFLKNQNAITLPIFGINHGYHQAAFLCEVENGFGSAELHSYPYLYSNINLNRTFFKFIARDKFNVAMASSSSGALTLINDEPYTNLYRLNYSFLHADKASYNGMADTYRSKLSFREQDTSSTLKLDVVMQDYKKGLFGKNFITMTSYSDLLSILKDLKSQGIENIEVNLIGYNKNGYFDNMQAKIKLASRLGSKKDYQALVDYAASNNISLYYYSNPLVANENNLSKQTVKMQNLEIFKYQFKSSLEQVGKVINPKKLSDYFLAESKRYDKLSMQNFTFEYVGSAAFSYRYARNNVAREEMIGILSSELDKITSQTNASIALSKPNSFLYPYISSYYDANYESSKYAFITDSIPFISLILSGNVKMFASNTNYVSDYNLFGLRLIEYNINPSFVITKEATNNLRYANFEYLYTTEYDLWRARILTTYNHVNKVLSSVSGAHMLEHSYIDDGIASVAYDNGVTIYLNYTNNDYVVGSTTIPAGNVITTGGDH